MKLKKILSNIKEEWYDYVKVRGKNVEVFVNPSRKDIVEMGEFIRFIADGKEKKLYVTDAFDGALHAELYNEIGFNHKEIIAGHFWYKKGKLMLVKDEKITLFDNEESLLNEEWDWMERYNVDMTWFRGIVNVDRVRKIDNIQGLEG